MTLARKLRTSFPNTRGSVGGTCRRAPAFPPRRGVLRSIEPEGHETARPRQVDEGTSMANLHRSNRQVQGRAHREGRRQHRQTCRAVQRRL